MPVCPKEQPGVPAATIEEIMLARGYVLVPYWGQSEDGRRIPCCRWVRLPKGKDEGLKKAPAKQGL